VRRRSRILAWAALAVALFAFYGFMKLNRELLGANAAEQERVLNVVLFLAWLPAIVVIIRAADFFLFDVFASRRGVARAPLLLRDLVAASLYAISLAWAIFSIFNYKVTTILATGTVVAAILGLAMQETLGNLFAGISLHVEDTFTPGDVIRTGDYIGIVEAVRWRATRLRTFNNNVVVVPNSMLARDRLEIFPRNNFNARVLQFSIEYNAPPARVIGILTQAAANVEGVVHDMPCIARIGGFDERSTVYEIKYFTSDYSARDRIDADIRRAVWYALRRNGIAFALPVRQYTRYAPAALTMHPDPSEIVERLRSVPILGPLPPQELQSIADVARVRVYSKGETILRQDDMGDSMFIVHDGAVSIRATDAEVARLEPGDFFGEMALLTGEHRTADVVALTDVVAVEIAKDALQPVLKIHPDLAASISARVVERRGALESRNVSQEEEELTIRSRIKAWFGLL
jgi:small-conductance mechanosensitive channel